MTESMMCVLIRECPHWGPPWGIFETHDAVELCETLGGGFEVLLVLPGMGCRVNEIRAYFKEGAISDGFFDVALGALLSKLGEYLDNRTIDLLVNESRVIETNQCLASPSSSSKN